MQTKHYIKVILPLRLEWEPCYWLEQETAVGQRVIVYFARRRTVGVVSETDVTPDIDESRIQPVLSVDSGLDPVSEKEIQFWRFISDYYLCTIGEVYKAAYPLLKTASEETGARSEQRRESLEALTIVRWQQRIEKLQARLEAVKANLAKKHGDAIRRRLEDKRTSICQELQSARDRLASFDKGLGWHDWSSLLKSISEVRPDSVFKDYLKTGKPVLFKAHQRNESYIRAAAEQLRNGRNVCILVNEISLATELCNLLKTSFGDLLLIHHSKMTRLSQRRISDAIRSGKPYVLIGTRSSIFLPHRDLGLIIVENEESAFYKQSDSAPRYNARDCAVQLSRIHGCGIILGTVSPSLESLYNARTGRYALLDDSGRMQPDYNLVDILAERKKFGMSGVFSRKLLDEMDASRHTALIRGFEKPEELAGAKADVFTVPQAAKTDFSDYDLVAVLNADALFNPADFRSDEHAFQFLERLRSSCPKLVVQTRQAGHQVYKLSTVEPLMEERRAFNLPPFSRLIELRLYKTDKSADLCRALTSAGFVPLASQGIIRVSLPRDNQLREKKNILRNTVDAFRSTHKTDIIIDVDPI